MGKDPRALVKEIVARVGKHGARKLLVSEGVSTSTTDKLVGARYSNEAGQLLRQAIERAHLIATRKAS